MSKAVCEDPAWESPPVMLNTSHWAEELFSKTLLFVYISKNNHTLVKELVSLLERRVPPESGLLFFITTPRHPGEKHKKRGLLKRLIIDQLTIARARGWSHSASLHPSSCCISTHHYPGVHYGGEFKQNKRLLANHTVWDSTTLFCNYPACSCLSHCSTDTPPWTKLTE